MGLSEDIEDFITRSKVDDRAADALKSEDEKTQRAVLERGDMADCRNPSASLISRIRVAKEGFRERSRSRSPPRSYGGGGGDDGRPSRDEIDGFIKDNKIDDMAGRQLKEADWKVQKNVLDRGNLTDCRNPSAVCLARIRDAKASQATPTISQLGLSATAPSMMHGGCYGYNPYAAHASYAAYAAAYQQAYYGSFPGYGAAYGMPPAGMPAGMPPGAAPPAYGAPAAYPGYPAPGAVPGGYPAPGAVPGMPPAGMPPPGYPMPGYPVPGYPPQPMAALPPPSS